MRTAPFERHFEAEFTGIRIAATRLPVGQSEPEFTVQDWDKLKSERKKAGCAYVIAVHNLAGSVHHLFKIADKWPQLK